MTRRPQAWRYTRTGPSSRRHPGGRPVAPRRAPRPPRAGASVASTPTTNGFVPVSRFGTSTRPVSCPPEEEDTLPPEQIRQIKHDTWGTSTRADFHAAPRTRRVLAVGDAWFDYALGLDLLDQLKRHHDQQIFRITRPELTLEHLVYGTAADGRLPRARRPLADVLDVIRELHPAVLVLSLGWNDVVGDELDALVNDRRPRLPVLRESHVTYLFSVAMRAAYRELIMLAADAEPGLQIVAHGYAEPVPDGRAAYGADAERVAGPWLAPALRRKDIVDADEACDVMRRLAEHLNHLLAELALEHRAFHHVDLRADIGPDDWANELHPKNSAFRRAAERLHDRIERARAGTP